jgi:diguanylate cyclase (GGDEF)-like protein/PAS domain S-box-containing protein
MPDRSSRRITWGFVAVLVIACAGAVAHALAPNSILGLPYPVVQTVAPMAVALIAARRLARREGWSWLPITVFGIGFSVAQVGWTALGYGSGPTAQGRWPDQVYSAVLPIGVIGLFGLAFRGLERRHQWRVLSDACVVATGLGLCGWVAFFDIPYRNGSLQHHAQGLIYPVLDIVAAAIIITAAIYQPHRPRLIWLAIAVGVAGCSDSLSVLRNSPATASRLVEVLLAVTWVAAPVLVAMGIAVEDRPAGPFAIGHQRRYLVSLFVMVGVLAATWAGMHDSSLEGPTLWIAVALGASAFVNQTTVFRELRVVLGEHRAIHDALRASEEEFRLTFEGAPVGIVVVDDGILRGANPTADTMMGIVTEGYIGRPARDLIGDDIFPGIDQGEWFSLTAGIETVHRDFEWSDPQGRHSWLHLSLARDPAGHPRRVIGILEDVTERHAITDRLAHMAVHDSLTGLPNRVAFRASLDAALARPDGGSVAVAFMDLDRFKVINDSVGHAVGDHMLREVAERIAGAVRGVGTVARFAGDEFTLLMLDRSRLEVSQVIARVQAALAEPLQLAEGVITYPTSSVGVGFGAAGIAADDLLARADAAMYRAKERGRNGVEYYDDTLGASAQSELRLVGEMHRALEQNEFRVFYQPVVEVATGMAMGFEALVRWQHPERGLLAPSEFIAAAEASGVIVPIGEWVMREALGQLATWHRRWPDHTLSMAVNVAARQVTEGLPELVRDVLATTRVRAEDVWLELTESALMFDIRSAEAVMQELRDLGVHMSVDDFGTGYSSLTYLQRLPVEGIKLDRSFVSGLGRRERDEAICHGVTSLGTALGLRTVGEGVETELQLDRLQEMGCELAQGYLYGSPQPADRIDEQTVTEPLHRHSEATARTGLPA